MAKVYGKTAAFNRKDFMSFHKRAFIWASCAWFLHIARLKKYLRIAFLASLSRIYSEPIAVLVIRKGPPKLIRKHSFTFIFQPRTANN